MEKSINEKFRESLENGYKNYLFIHPRSCAKIVPMHRSISEIILEKLGGVKNDFSIKSMGIGDGKEFNLEGKYYSKDIDITILFKNKPTSGIGFKFITSNYKQNSNYYFENFIEAFINLTN